jgi:Trk K+ transport system NAD-binding subunit
MNLIQRLKQYQYAYVIITEDIKHALELFDQDDKVVVGDLTDPETYRRLRVGRAALVVANIDGMMNTNVLLKPDDVLMLAEGLNVFRAGMHASLVGKSLVESQIRMQTGCSVIAINQDGKMVSNPDPSVRLSEKDELIMIGTDDAENRFLKRYPEETKTKVV